MEESEYYPDISFERNVVCGDEVAYWLHLRNTATPLNLMCQVTSYENMAWDLISMQQFEKELKAFSLFLHNEPALA
jgi:hypothetical protein